MASFSTIRGTAAADSGLLTVTRTSSEPARHKSATCFTVEATSAVSVLVIDCTTIGWLLPTWTLPTFTVGVARRGAPDGSLTSSPAPAAGWPGPRAADAARRNRRHSPAG